MVKYKTWEESRAEGRAEARAASVLTVLRARGIAVPDASRERILAEKDLEQLQRWLEMAGGAAASSETRLLSGRLAGPCRASVAGHRGMTDVGTARPRRIRLM
jgi:hypothetical protein